VHRPGAPAPPGVQPAAKVTTELAGLADCCRG